MTVTADGVLGFKRKALGQEVLRSLSPVASPWLRGT